MRVWRAGRGSSERRRLQVLQDETSAQAARSRRDEKYLADHYVVPLILLLDYYYHWTTTITTTTTTTTNTSTSDNSHNQNVQMLSNSEPAGAAKTGMTHTKVL